MIIVLSTYPDGRSAGKAARDLVGCGLAACVSIIRIESSIYIWKGKVERHPERLLIIKAGRSAYSAIEARIRKTHPHKVPEIVYLDVAGGQPDYLAWVASATRPCKVPLDSRATSRACAPPRADTRARKPRARSR